MSDSPDSFTTGPDDPASTVISSKLTLWEYHIDEGGLNPARLPEERLSEIESIGEIKRAVLETNGDISFIKQPGS